MQNNNVKSSVVAGLLGIFLGSFGAHNWYLGDKKKGAIHVCLFAAGFLIGVITGILQASLSWYTVYKMGWLFALLGFVYIAIIGANEIWGFVEGIMILVKGDADLAAKGYKVAAPAAYPAQGAPTAAAPANDTTNAAPAADSAVNPAPATLAESAESAEKPAAESAPVTDSVPAETAPAVEATPADEPATTSEEKPAEDE